MSKTLRLNNLKSRAAINAKISVFVICVEVIIYLLLYNLHDGTFNKRYKKLRKPKKEVVSANIEFADLF